MKKRMKRAAKWVRFKNIRKVIRTIIQYVILVVITYQIINALVSFKDYIPTAKEENLNNDSFIAVSYFGIARSTTSDHVSQKELRAQLGALFDHGYKTISQEDIINFYTKKEPLPEKALYLAFEDGRNDSALFSIKVLEKLNYQATMLTYANKMGDDKQKFLQPKELLSMEKNGFWQLGTNGYRLSYINIIDKDKQYFPHLSQEEFNNKTAAYYYTHYLMDYIRNEHYIPIESRQEMQERINTDYDLVEQIYIDKLGYIPRTYMIMHADSLYNGMHAAVEEVNDTRIRELFDLHFNREGSMLNTISDDRFNLTRVQPAPYWRTNHLLMKLQLDTGDSVNFVIGDTKEAAKWTLIDGVAEFAEEEIALTTRPSKKASMTINNLALSESFSLDVTLGGHSSGIQLVQLGHSADGQLKLQLRVEDEQLFIEYVYSNGVIERVAAVRAKDRGLEDIPISLTVLNNTLTAKIKNRIIVNQEALYPQLTEWKLVFEAQSLNEENRWEDDGEYIYDGIFKHIKIESINAQGEKEKVLFSNSLKGIDKGLYTIQTFYNKLLDWAIETF